MKTMRSLWWYLGIGASSCLIALGFAGPIYAFAIMSCVSTRPCQIASLLRNIGSSCAEGADRSSTLLHGEACTVSCGIGMESTVPQLVCIDGNTIGAESLRCIVPTVTIGLVDTKAKIQTDAVIGNRDDANSACVRAQSLACKALPGGSSILVQLQGVSQIVCNGIFAECQGLNSRFTFEEYVQSSYSLSLSLDPYNTTLQNLALQNPGMCRLGCSVAVSAQANSQQDTESPSPPPAASTGANDCNVGSVVNGYNPPCTQGAYLKPGGVCTPRCWFGYAPFPSNVTFRCFVNGTYLVPSYFECRALTTDGTGADEFGRISPGYDVASGTTTLVPCSAIDCNYRGAATGWRRQDGSCACVCFSGFTGPQCRTTVGNCTAPIHRELANSLAATCREGNIVSKTCTGQCESGYYAVPESLICKETTLYPSTFRCFTADVDSTWCNAMKILSVVTSVASFCGLAATCYMFQRGGQREPKDFVVVDQSVQIKKDDYGHFGIVHNKIGEDKLLHVSKMPSYITPLAPPDEVALEDVSEFSPQAPTTPGRMNSRLPLEGNVLRQVADGSVSRALSRPGTAHSSRQTTKSSAPSTFTEMLALQQRRPLDTISDRSGSGSGVMVSVEPRLRKGREVILGDIPGRADLDDARGWLVDFDPGSGCWTIDLEGKELLKQIPESYLSEAIEPAAPAAAAVAPLEGKKLDLNWLMEARNLESQALQRKKEHEAKFASEAARAEQQRQQAITEKMKATEEFRFSLDEGIREALRRGDGEELRKHVLQAREYLQDPLVVAAPASTLVSLRRLMETAEARLEQFDQREESRARKREYDERVRTGKAADWKMTPAEFWRHVAECNDERVEAGLKAKLPVFTRSTDGQRFTLVHEACRKALSDQEGSDVARRRLHVVELLLEARANANAVDARDRTPLDLAIELGKGEKKGHSSVKALKRLGLLTARQAAAVALGKPLEESEDEAQEITQEVRPQEAEPTVDTLEEADCDEANGQLAEEGAVHEDDIPQTILTEAPSVDAEVTPAIWSVVDQDGNMVEPPGVIKDGS